MPRKFSFALLLSLGVLAACTQAVPLLEEVRVLPAATPTAVPPPSLGWNRRTLNGGGGQPSISIDPTNSAVVYVTTDNGGIVKTTDGGETWVAINNNLGNPRLGDSELDPLDAQVLYVVAEVYSQSPSYADEPVNGELYRTLDGGATWEVVYAEGMGQGEGRAFGIVQWPSTHSLLIPFDPNDPTRFDQDGDRMSDVLYIGGWDNNDDNPDKRAGIWRSVDEGANFTQLALPNKNIWALRADPRDPLKLYAATYGDGIWVSGDGGETWESWRDRLPLPMTSDIAIDAVHNILYVTTNVFYSEYVEEAYRPLRGIYKSTDGGQTFALINTGLDLSARGYETLLIDQTDPTGLTLITGNFKADQPNVYLSTNGGQHWAPMPLINHTELEWLDHIKNLWDLAQASDGTLYATSWRGIFRYNREQKVWEVKSEGLGNIAVRTVAFEPGNDAVIYLGLLDSTPYKSVNWGATWESIGHGFLSADGEQTVGAEDIVVAPTNTQVVYATGIGPSGEEVGAVLKSTNGGQTWERIVNGLPPSPSDDPTWVARAIAVSAHDPEVAYVALDVLAGEGQVYKTTDGGQTWQVMLTVSERATDLALSATEPETVVLVTNQGGVFISDSAGQTWREARLKRASLIYSVAVYPSDPNFILLGVNAVGAYLSRDGGQAWEPVFGEADLPALMDSLALSAHARERYAPTITSVQFDPATPTTLFIGHNPRLWMGLGVLRSIDSGQTWRPFATSEKFQMGSVHTFDIDPLSNNLVVGSWEVYYYANRR